MATKPRIALWHNLPSGGSKRQVWYHVRGLVARGYSVTAFRPPVKESGYLDLREWVEEIELPLDLPPSLEGRLFAQLGKAYHLPESQQAAMMAHAELFAKRAQEFDLTFANTCYQFAVPFVARFLPHQPTLLYLNEPSRPLYEARPELPWAKTVSAKGSLKERVAGPLEDAIKLHEVRYRTREARKSAAAFKKILSNSLYSRESILRAYGLDNSVCYLGVDTALFPDLKLEREPFVLGLGLFDPNKNVRLAIDALSEIPANRPALVWICNGVQEAYRIEMEIHAESKGVKLEIRTMVSDKELVETLNRATALLYTSRLEPFGLAPLEANSCGTPVVAVPEGGIRETVLHGKNGLLGLTPEELGTHIKTLMGDKNLARQLGEGGKAWVASEWTLESSIDRLEMQIQKL